MAGNYILPLKAPNPLPADGVTAVTFKVWKNTLVAHVSQDSNHHLFMPGGLYSQWRAAEYGSRIQNLDDDDQEKLVIDGKLERLGAAAHRAELTRLRVTRNAQLSKFVTHVATLCHHTENDDVTQHSTSLEWIFDYLKKHYGLETKGANFMNISEHVYKKGTPYQTFYKQYRASFIDNLRKQGDIVQYRNNFTLTEDEKLSPSFENAIILWTLEKIDARLPAKIKKNYGHQMTGNTTLKDIQPVIFEHIDILLEELDQFQTNKLLASQVNAEDDVELHAINIRKSGNRNNSNRSKSRSFREQVSAKQPKSLNQSTSKYCRICHLAGSDKRVFSSHEIGNCSRLSVRDLESLRDALVLNGMVSVSEHESPEPVCQLQPGWDFDQQQSSAEESNQTD